MNAAWGRLISLPKKRQRKPLWATATMLLLAMLTATPAWAQNIYTRQIGIGHCTASRCGLQPLLPGHPVRWHYVSIARPAGGSG